MSEKEAKNYTQIWAICLVLLTQRQRCMRLYILDGWMDVFVCTCIFFHFVRCYCCYCRCFIYLGKKLKFNYIILLHAHTNWIMNETRKNKCVCMCAEERKKKQLKKKNELCASDVYDSGFCLFWGHTHTYEKNIYTLSTMALLLLWFFFSFGISLPCHTCDIFGYLVSKNLTKKQTIGERAVEKRYIQTTTNLDINLVILTQFHTHHIYIYTGILFIVDCMDVAAVGAADAGFILFCWGWILFAKPYACTS